MKRLVTVFASVWICLAAAPGAASAVSGSIAGVAIDPSLTHVTIQNLGASYDLCEVEQAGKPTCTWRAVAYLNPPTASQCHGLHPFHAVLPPTITAWETAAAGDGTVDSGPLTLPLDGVNDKQLCLYVSRSSELSEELFNFASDLVASHRLHVDLPAPPGPDITPGIRELSFPEARKLLATALGGWFRSWPKGNRKQVTCEKRIAPNRVLCQQVRWSKGRQRFAGRATIWLTESSWAFNFHIVAVNTRCQKLNPGAPSRCKRVVRKAG